MSSERVLRLTRLRCGGRPPPTSPSAAPAPTPRNQGKPAAASETGRPRDEGRWLWRNRFKLWGPSADKLLRRTRTDPA